MGNILLHQEKRHFVARYFVGRHLTGVPCNHHHLTVTTQKIHVKPSSSILNLNHVFWGFSAKRVLVKQVHHLYWTVGPTREFTLHYTLSTIC
jgi:hypothetical protein